MSKLNNLIRIGTVSHINEAEGTVDVVYRDSDDMVSTDLQILKGNDPPVIDEMVLVVYLTDDPTSGYVIGSPRNEVMT